MLNKTNQIQSGIMTIGSKNPKNRFLLHFDPIVRAWVLNNWVEDTPFLSSLYQFDFSLDW